MAQIVLPNQLTNGTVADATQVMANFQAIVDVVNGNLGSDNLSSLSGNDVTCIDLNGGIATLNTFTQRFQAGWVLFNEVPPNTRTLQTVGFPNAFPDRPIVFTTVNDPGAEYWDVSANHVSSSQFDFVVHNGNKNDSLTVYGYWLAVYVGAGAPSTGW